MCSSLHTCFSAPFICDEKRTTVRWARSKFYLHQTMAAKPLCDVNLKVVPCAYLPQRGVELMDDHFHLLTASKGHDGIIAGKRSRLREVGHCVKQKNNHYQAMMVNNIVLWSFYGTARVSEFFKYFLFIIFVHYLFGPDHFYVDRQNKNQENFIKISQHKFVSTLSTQEDINTTEYVVLFFDGQWVVYWVQRTPV